MQRVLPLIEIDADIDLDALAKWHKDGADVNNMPKGARVSATHVLVETL